jgi:hypothetical protein
LLRSSTDGDIQEKDVSPTTQHHGFRRDLLAHGGGKILDREVYSIDQGFGLQV